ncbi:S8 family serine peptidase [Salinarimonas rosea]|uniref:S8 family serine peptidase n=1 Tax=Salinarimonas rosea TaxID=552063 RepID=UPI000413DF21|nr:S8 family serine peptidase [Salinarimonas rosea]
MAVSPIVALLGLVLGLLALEPRLVRDPHNPHARAEMAILASALADDDDDDDGGSAGLGGPSSDASSSRGSSDGTAAPAWRPPQGEGLRPLMRLLGVEPRRPARPAPPRAPLPLAADREIIAVGLSEPLLSALVAEGYVLLESVLLERLGARLVRLRLPEGVGPEEARDGIAARAPAARVDLEHFYRRGSAPAVHSPRSSVCAGPACAAPRLVAWPERPGVQPACARDLRIGMIDSGINVAHESLRDARIATVVLDPDAEGSDAVHGTSVAALLVGAPESRTPGLLPKAQLLAVDIFQGAPEDDLRAGAFAFARGLDRFVGADVPVVNLSLAGPPNAVVERLVARLVADGVALVAASGNAGPRAAPAYPAAYEGVVAVTAVDGSVRVYRRAGRGAHIDVAAPGVDVWAAASIRGARPRTGTSFAAPFATAAIALALEAGVASDAQAARALLAANARDLGDPGHDEVFGAGLLQVGRLCDGARMTQDAGSP